MAAFILGLGCPSFDGAPIPIDFQSEKKGKRIELTIGSLSSALLVPACGAVAARAEKSSGDGWELGTIVQFRAAPIDNQLKGKNITKRKCNGFLVVAAGNQTRQPSVAMVTLR